MITAIPDDKQQERIQLLMINDDQRYDTRCGLMVMGDRLIRDHYGNTYQARHMAEKYLECIQHFQKVSRAIFVWLARSAPASPFYAWMEPHEQNPESRHPMQQQQSRSDHHSGRRGHQQQQHIAAAYVNRHDPNAVDSDGYGSSEMEDDIDDLSDDGMPSEMIVDGCGVAEINGVYKKKGIVDDCPKYVHTARYRGRDEEFHLFRCKLTDNTRRWYISIVPPGAHPGTTKDIDFYAAVPSKAGDVFPPEKNWMCIPNGSDGGGGVEPPPMVHPGSPSMYDDDVVDNENHHQRGGGRGSNIVADREEQYL